MSDPISLILSLALLVAGVVCTAVGLGLLILAVQWLLGA